MCCGAGEPHPYHFVLEGPLDGQLLADYTLLARAFHAALNLPAAYSTSNISIWAVAAPLISRHLLAAASNKVTFGFQLPGLGLQDALAVEKLIQSDAAATAVVLQLVVVGLVDPTVIGQLTAGFSDAQGDVNSASNMHGKL